MCAYVRSGSGDGGNGGRPRRRKQSAKGEAKEGRRKSGEWRGVWTHRVANS